MKEKDELTKIFVESMVKATLGGMENKQDESIDGACKRIAENHKKIFDAHVAVGFSKAESFEILVAFIKKVGK